MSFWRSPVDEATGTEGPDAEAIVLLDGVGVAAVIELISKSTERRITLRKGVERHDWNALD